MTKQYAVLGSPISQSLSPQLHRAAFDYQEIDADYSRIELASNLGGFLRQRGKDLAGVSITMPLKEEAFQFADERDPQALATGACNALIREGNKWHGFNTDVIGIIKAIDSIPSGHVLIIGSGATARSAFEACRLRGDSIAVWARSRLRLTPLQIDSFDEQALGHFESFELVVSTIPLAALDGLLPDIHGVPKYLLSASYGTVPEPVAEFFSKCEWIDGREMLLWQAVAQQALFANSSPDAYLENSSLVAVMRSALGRPVGE